jgi:hypothetical protein
MKKSLLFVFCLTIFYSFSQVVIERANLPEAGLKQYVRMTNSADINIGTAIAEAQIWDFSALESDELDSVQYISVEKTPYALQIGNTADFALNIDNELGSTAIPFTNNYLFMKEEDNGIFGNAIAVNAMGDIVVLQSDNPEIVFPYPMNYGDVIYDTSEYAATITSPIMISFSRKTTKTISVDAFGSMILEEDTIEVIRVYEVANIVDDFGSITENTEHRYYFYAKNPNYQHPVVSILQSENGNIEMVSWVSEEYDTTKTEVYDSTNAITEIMELNMVEFYPNPAVDHINIQIKDHSINHLQTNVYNFLGQVVYSNSTNPNVTGYEVIIDLNNFTPGAYFIEFKDDMGRSSAARFQVSN